ncbi:spore germination protein [Thalassobacillus sp. CUG 92003]|uniref:spore germination protein n=1 Tax=Thalassobacillus sp. CUG 92003 TaxID=2736641 RepID=UPI0015E6BB80|nr:spore germination protein [Thalassobacillus sp. CUG 92003]
MSSKSNTNQPFPLSASDFKQRLSKSLQGSPDLVTKTFHHHEQEIIVCFLTYQVNKEQLDRNLLKPLVDRKRRWDEESLLNTIPLSSGKTQNDLDSLAKQLIGGHVCLYIAGADKAVTFFTPQLEHRALTQAETESLVFGPQISFTESMVTNLNIVRWRLNNEELVTEKIIVGERVPTEVRLVYIKSLTNEENVQTVRQRLQDLLVDEVEDTSVLGQYIEDSSSSIFPQLIFTELPDRFCYSITKGKVGIMVDKSPTALIGPTTLFSFFESTEDIYMRWNMGTFIRLLRFTAMFISIILTPLYVAALTYHYEVVPGSLLVSLGQSRAMVPFPPIMEALLLELLIELLREAGARLPTKVGQTMGIVGGIVLGQAAVQAGFTSNILIIIVALSALASFTAPSYLMGTAIRIIRFPMIILGGLWGLIGILFGLSFLIIHVLKLTSLGRPYLSPLYPMQRQDLGDSFIRLPFKKNNTRPISNMPKDTQRYPKQQAARKKDIDD